MAENKFVGKNMKKRWYVALLVADGDDIAANPSQHEKTNDHRDEDDDDMSDEASEAAASSSDSDEQSSDDDERDDKDEEFDDETQKNVLPARTTSPSEGRKRRLQEHEDSVKLESESNIRGILRGSTSSPAAGNKRVKFTANKNTDSDSDSHPVYREDIYGRLRDKHGNIVNPDEVDATTGQVGMYVPPGKRQKLVEESGSCSIDKSSGESKQRVEKLTRQVKGQINRLVF